MKRIIGIISIVFGVFMGIFALTRHEDDKKIIDLGKIELKKEDKSPSSNTTLYYVLSAVFIIGGVALMRGKDGA